MESLGERLAHRRTERGLSLRQLAARTGLKAQNISRIETGKRAHVRSDTLERLAEALLCTTDYLLGRAAQPTIPAQRPRPRTAAPVG